MGMITSFTMQGQCGSSYAFSAAGALEGANALTTGNLVTLSEQNIIDCSGTQTTESYRASVHCAGIRPEESCIYHQFFSVSLHLLCHYLLCIQSTNHMYVYFYTVPYGNYGCRGGNMYNTFLYIVTNEGIDTYNSYPFQGKVNDITTHMLVYKYSLCKYCHTLCCVANELQLL